MGMLDVGYLTLGRFRGTPILIHWTAFVVALIYGRFTFAPGIWLGYLLIIGLHELGHAILARRYGLHVRAIKIHGLGGVTEMIGHETQWSRSVIAWGGVLAQALLFAAATAFLWFVPLPQTVFTYQLLNALTEFNALIMALNLIPFPPLDGAEAWKIFGLWQQRRQRQTGGQRQRGGQARKNGDSSPKRGNPNNLRLIKSEDERVRETVRRALESARDSDRHNLH